MNRRVTLLLLASIASGCASKGNEPLTFAPNVALQDPLPGRAIVYLLRIPNDRPTVEVYLAERKVAVLPPSTYTVVSLEPGTYQLASSPAESAANAPASVLTVKAGERRFLYTSIPTRSSSTLSLVGAGAAGVIPLVTPTTVPIGTRAWTECRELDAQGLMSTSRPVPPQPGAA